MANPTVHSESAARIWGGTAADYFAIHQFMDSSLMAFPDNRHRALTHQSWFCSHVVPLACGQIVDGVRTNYIINSAGRRVFVKDIAYQHCIEDFCGYVPSAADYLNEMTPQAWLNNAMMGAAPPPSRAKYRIVRDTGVIEEVNKAAPRPPEVFD